MRSVLFLAFLAATTAANALAQQGPRVPAIQYTQAEAIPAANTPAAVPDTTPRYPPPPVNLLSNKNATLTPREKQALALSRSWVGNATMPARGDAGAVMFTFGATLPSVVCAPLYVCDITLQPGEVVNDINIGDAVRWKVSPATSGAGPNATTHVIVKPTDAALSTNLVITTDRRTYVLKLVSRQKDWMPRVAFHYPEDTEAAWAAYKAARQAAINGTVLDSGQNVAALDFGYRLSGDKPRWRPLRVYSDGSKTYIQFPEAMQSSEAPALVAIGADQQEQLVNYRLVGNRYVVDKVLERAALLSGVGRRQVKVEIQRSGRP